jgi:hypothetical protein
MRRRAVSRRSAVRDLAARGLMVLDLVFNTTPSVVSKTGWILGWLDLYVL